MALRLFLVSILAFFGALTAQAAERIHNFDVDIEVRTDGDILVTETIEVTGEGVQIRRGIYRSLPRYYKDKKEDQYRYGYSVKSVTRNGRKEPYAVLKEGNAYTIRMGDEDVFLPVGERQTYVIQYLVKNQVRYFEDHDEIYWNVTGTYWNFPIDAASATLTFPEGVRVQSLDGYTGRFGEAGKNYSVAQNGNVIEFRTTEPLLMSQGMTVSVSINKGLIDPPSFSDKLGLFWQKYLGLLMLAGTLVGVGIYYYSSWLSVGRDAAKLPVFPIYEPPKDISPAGAHMIYYRSYKGNEAFSASLLSLATQGYLEIESEKKEVTISRLVGSGKPQLLPEEQTLNDSLFGSSMSRSFGKKYDSSFATTFTNFKSRLQKKYGDPYFRWNTGYVLLAGAASIAIFFIAMANTLNWTSWHTLAVVGLIVTNLAFLYLMPARTKKGAKARSEIAGLRLYMETAEKHQMNMADPISGGPPAMSKERYEQLLPYAMALNVEKPWTKYFEKMLPNEAQNYDPTWSRGRFLGHSLHNATRSLENSINSSVSTASVKPSSSSGGGGGGFSGGGGGGGGGGGW